MVPSRSELGAVGLQLSMSLHEQFQSTIRPALQSELGVTNAFAVPRVEKIVLNVGMGGASSDPGLPDVVSATLERITGQRPVRTLARKSIAAFKIRSGNPVGMMVTLRGRRMWDFLEKLIRVSLPRVRDFRGISPRCVDGRGNLSIGFPEHIVFPEILPDDVEKSHGVQVTVVTNAGSRARGVALFRSLGFPLQKI